MKSLADILPAMFMEADSDGSLLAFTAAFDGVQVDLVEEIQGLADVSLPGRTPFAFVGNVADRFGNPFQFLTPFRVKDKLGSLVSIYKRRGTKAGITAVCFYLCGVLPEIVEDFQWGWKLGVSTLQVNTRLADGSSPIFWVKIASSVPQAVRDEIASVVNFMKPSKSQWRFVLVNGILPHGALESAVIASEILTVQGWAASVLQGCPAAWVDIQLDGVSIGHADLDEVTVRNDVQALMTAAGSNKDCTHPQFLFSIPINNLQSGARQVSAVATQYDGQVAVVGTININI